MEKMSGIELFAHIAQQGSLVAAGRQLGISASAAGKGLARLEARLGARLVQRSTRRLTLTTAGEQYLQRCLRILDEVEAAERELQQGQAAPRGRLKVGLPHECGVLAPHLASFMQSYPEIELDLDYSDRLVDVIGEGFDVVIRGGEPGDSRLSARRLGAYRMRLVAGLHRAPPTGGRTVASAAGSLGGTPRHPLPAMAQRALFASAAARLHRLLCRARLPRGLRAYSKSGEQDKAKTSEKAECTKGT
ncbi:LysR family transcriptional regulator [Chromobacterium haemolyticum]|uniref:LysR family transcriptional regulator n=1 Tax=Chromobacterium haemolyticum TaxID=394935 RepID=UPI004057672B